MDNPWTIASKSKAKENALNLASKLNCPTEPQDLLKCLQEKTTEQIMDAFEMIKVYDVFFFFKCPSKIEIGKINGYEHSCYLFHSNFVSPTGLPRSPTITLEMLPSSFKAGLLFLHLNVVISFKYNLYVL